MGIDRYCTHICSPGRIHRPAPAESSPRSHSFRPHSSIQSSLLSLTPTCIVSSYSLPSLPLSLSSHSSFPPPFFFFVLSPMSLVTVRCLHPSPSPRSSSYSVHPSAGAPAGAFVADGNGSTPEQVDAGRTIAHYNPLPPPVSRRLLPACQPDEWREKRRREGGTNGWVEEDKKILKLEDGGGNEGEQMSSRPSGLSSVTVASKIIQSKL